MQIDNNLFFSLVEEQLNDGKRVQITLKGTSMTPTLHEGDTLLIEPLVGTPAVGDVLLFCLGGNHFVHRLIRIDGDNYIMRGDNNLSTETARRADLLARLVEVRRTSGNTVRTDSNAWQRLSRHALRRSAVKRTAARWLGRKKRKQLRPWYFVLLAILMWAPLNGLGVPLDNYILGLRADHLLHASVYLLCPLFLMDLFDRLGVHGRSWAVWGSAVAVGLLTESVQYLLPYRGYDVNDLVANALGVTLGWLIILLARRFLLSKSTQ